MTEKRFVEAFTKRAVELSRLRDEETIDAYVRLKIKNHHKVCCVDAYLTLVSIIYWTMRIIGLVLIAVFIVMMTFLSFNIWLHIITEIHEIHVACKMFHENRALVADHAFEPDQPLSFDTIFAHAHNIYWWYGGDCSKVAFGTELRRISHRIINFMYFVIKDAIKF